MVQSDLVLFRAEYAQRDRRGLRLRWCNLTVVFFSLDHPCQRLQGLRPTPTFALQTLRQQPGSLNVGFAAGPALEPLVTYERVSLYCYSLPSPWKLQQSREQRLVTPSRTNEQKPLTDPNRSCTNRLQWKEGKGQK